MFSNNKDNYIYVGLQPTDYREKEPNVIYSNSDKGPKIIHLVKADTV